MGLRKAAKKMVVAACASFSRKKAPVVDPTSLSPDRRYHHISDSTAMPSSTPRKRESMIAEEAAQQHPATTKNNVSSKNICAICLDPLSYSTGSGSSPGQAIFTAQCSHAFHFACISSNVRHGSVTCPICRAHWTQLPRNLTCSHSRTRTRTDPILQILDDSIANFRVHRQSFLRSARYDDDDPIEADSSFNHSRLDFSLIPIQAVYPSFHSYRPCDITLTPQPMPVPVNHNNSIGSSSLLHQLPPVYSLRRAYLSVKLSHQQATDLVLVASPNGPHLRLLKQSMALVVFSLRPIDRLAIVTYSSAAARIFPLKRMTWYGKRAALQVIDRLFYMGQADPSEGFKKGMKILEDRVHNNPQSCILHLSDSPTRSYRHPPSPSPGVPLHQFHVGFGASNGLVMHELERLLARVLGGAIRDVELRIGEEGSVIRLGEMRGGEERRIVMELEEDEHHVFVEYSYREGEGEGEECGGSDEEQVVVERGEAVVSIGGKRMEMDQSSSCSTATGKEEEGDGMNALLVSGGNANGSGRSSCVESWEYHYHDPCMARRWAKHLHAAPGRL